MLSSRQTKNLHNNTINRTIFKANKKWPLGNLIIWFRWWRRLSTIISSFRRRSELGMGLARCSRLEWFETEDDAQFCQFVENTHICGKIRKERFRGDYWNRDWQSSTPFWYIDFWAQSRKGFRKNMVRKKSTRVPEILSIEISWNWTIFVIWWNADMSFDFAIIIISFVPNHI